MGAETERFELNFGSLSVSAAQVTAQETLAPVLWELNASKCQGDCRNANSAISAHIILQKSLAAKSYS